MIPQAYNLSVTMPFDPVERWGHASAVGEGEEEQTRILPAPKVNFRRASHKDVRQWRELEAKGGKELGWKKALRQHVFMGSEFV